MVTRKLNLLTSCLTQRDLNFKYNMQTFRSVPTIILAALMVWYFSIHNPMIVLISKIENSFIGELFSSLSITVIELNQCHLASELLN